MQFLVDLLQRGTSRKFLLVVAYMAWVSEFNPDVAIAGYVAVLVAIFVFMEGRADTIEREARILGRTVDPND